MCVTGEHYLPSPSLPLAAMQPILLCCFFFLSFLFSLHCSLGDVHRFHSSGLLTRTPLLNVSFLLPATFLFSLISTRTLHAIVDRKTSLFLSLGLVSFSSSSVTFLCVICSVGSSDTPVPPSIAHCCLGCIARARGKGRKVSGSFYRRTLCRSA